MSMRKHLRAVARANMERDGYQKINKPRRDPIKGGILPSFFAAEWRKHTDTRPEIAKKCKAERELLERKRAERNARRAARRAASA